jgi:hypothetical protein
MSSFVGRSVPPVSEFEATPFIPSPDCSGKPACAKASAGETCWRMLKVNNQVLFRQLATKAGKPVI